jgi:hypothetical protein
MAREKKLHRSEACNRLGEKTIARIYRYADVFHCEPIAAVADEFEGEYLQETGKYDNVAECKYTAPDYWTIGKVFSRLIEDVMGDKPVLETLQDVYRSWISDAISNYNSDFFYQPREYLKECYLAGEVL